MTNKFFKWLIKPIVDLMDAFAELIAEKVHRKNREDIEDYSR